MLYIKSLKDTKLYINGGLQDVKAGDSIGVPVDTYNVLQSNKEYEPISSYFDKWVWKYILVADKDGSSAINGVMTTYKKGDTIESTLVHVRHLLLNGFSGYKGSDVIKEDTKTSDLKDTIESKEEISEEVVADVAPATEEVKNIVKKKKGRPSKNK